MLLIKRKRQQSILRNFISFSTNSNLSGVEIKNYNNQLIESKTNVLALRLHNSVISMYNEKKSSTVATGSCCKCPCESEIERKNAFFTQKEKFI